MWLVSCRKQGKLTQGPAPDPKCKLNFTSFLTLPHSFDCPICAKSSLFIVLFVQILGGRDVCGWGEGREGVYIIFFFVRVVFCFILPLVPFIRSTRERWSCVVFFFLLISLSSVPLTRRYCCFETVVLVFCFSIVGL